MCRTTQGKSTDGAEKTTSNTTTGKQPPRPMISLESYASEHEHPPQLLSVLYSGIVIVGGLVASEIAWRFFLSAIQGWHPILEEEVNRQILARHLGVDTLSLFILAVMGWQARDIVWCVMDAWFGGKKGAVTPAGYLNRLYTVHPEGIRIGVFFFWYQVKNTYDTFVWDDGPEYVFHHIFSLITALVTFGPFFCHFYAVFYLALCEVSTCVLCVLANFDDKQGVPGLGEAFPTAKVVVGGMFVVLFIICRCITWPIYAYHFFTDTQMALKEPMDSRTTVSRQRWLKFLCVSLTSLSVLQIAWLGQIFMIANEELTKMGYI